MYITNDVCQYMIRRKFPSSPMSHLLIITFSLPPSLSITNRRRRQLNLAGYLSVQPNNNPSIKKEGGGGKFANWSALCLGHLKFFFSVCIPLFTLPLAAFFTSKCQLLRALFWLCFDHQHFGAISVWKMTIP